MTLCDLLLKNDNYHSVSGGGIGTDKEWRHRYCSAFYDKHFLDYKDKELNLLEIGTGHGGSLFLWHDYFSKANITGIDVNNYTDPKINRLSRAKTIITNAYSLEVASNLPDFDIVIDDGPHTFDTHIQFLRLYLPKVKAGGVLVIEDIPDINWPKKYEEYCTGYKHLTIDTREETGLHDNIMFVVWK